MTMTVVVLAVEAAVGDDNAAVVVGEQIEPSRTANRTARGCVPLYILPAVAGGRGPLFVLCFGFYFCVVLARKVDCDVG